MIKKKDFFLAGVVMIAAGGMALAVCHLPWSLRGVAYIAFGIYLIRESTR